jgi:PAS domain S-box-containing protein
MKKKIKILHLEDSINDSYLIRSLIDTGEIEHEYFLADNENDFINLLETENIDIILSDYNLPDYNGNEALKVAREKYSHIPFIFVSGTIGEDAAINAMLNGATDYVLKNKLERLVPAIKRAQREHELEITRKQAEIALIESEKKYRELVNEVNDGYFVTDNQGIITFANFSMAKIFGFGHPDELTGLSFSEFNKTNNAHHTFKNLIENKKKVNGLEMEIQRVDSNSVHIEIKVVPVLENREITGMQGVIHDITERKLAEMNLKEKNEVIEAQNAQYIQINIELAYQNEEKEKRAAELFIANKELAFQTEEKEKRAAELIIANIKKAEEEKYKHLIEEKNIVITDSINYAKRIQQAKLPRKEEIYEALPESFVLFKPKDIVSGDFYFFYKNDQSVIIVAADCTGHGVPGAFMSVIGSEKLTEAVRKSNGTSEILKHLNNGIKRSLHQSESYESTKDGMDIAICSIDIINNVVSYAGANIPFWLIRNGVSEIEEIKGTKDAIGGFTENDKYYESHELKLQKGDTFYISSDGYADQFGGQNGKKLMKRKFQKILLEIQNKSMREQEIHLDNYVEEWKSGIEQVDDILVIGVRL